MLIYFFCYVPKDFTCRHPTYFTSQRSNMSWLIFTGRMSWYCPKEIKLNIFCPFPWQTSLLSLCLLPLLIVFSLLSNCVWSRASSHISCQFSLYTIYVSDTNCSSVPFILAIDFDFFPSILWSLMWSIWYTWVQPFILFHWFHSWSF
jgi:hypothetical protein